MAHTLTTTAIPANGKRVNWKRIACACGWFIEGWAGSLQSHVEAHLRAASDAEEGA